MHTEYTIVADDNLDNFIEKVKELMAEGWIALGGVGLGSLFPMVKMYNQAMVK